MARPSQSLDLNAARLELFAAEKVAFGHDREKTVGASEIGQCFKRIAMKKQGVEPDEDYADDPGFAERGNILENYLSVPLMQRAVDKMGGKLHWAGQKEQTTIVVEKWFASVTPDGVVSNAPKTALKEYGVPKLSTSDFLVEFKSADPRLKLDTPKDAHDEQVNYGLGLVRFDGEFNPEHGLLLYVDASSLKLKPFVIKFEEQRFKRQLKRAKSIMTTPWQKAIAEGHIKGGKDCRYCEFFTKCTGRQRSKPK